MPRKTPTDPTKMRKETREWLSTHTLQDVRGIAKDLENAGEDIHELLGAIDELEALLQEEPARGSRGTAAKADA